VAEARRYPPNLIPPRTAEGLFPQQRLLEALGEQAQCKLVVVSAPAGFGKTALAVSYLAQSGQPSAWYTLDESYKDGARFLNHLALSIHRAFPALDIESLPALGEGTAFSPSHANFVDELAAAFNAVAAERTILVLDGFQNVQESPAVVQAMDLLVPRLPAGCQLILISRTRPTLTSLPRLLTYGQAMRFTAQDLAFTEEETAEWLRESDLGIPESEAHHLWAHYEGWIAGMALAVNQAAFNGSDLFGPSGADEQDWFEYVETEVFQSLPAELQDFLSNTSILNELEPGICDGLLGTEGSFELLKSLADGWNLLQRVPRATKFRCPTGPRRFLVHRLREQGESHLAAVHQRAATYFLEQEQWESAIHHYCEADRPEDAAKALQVTMAEMYSSGGWERLAQLIDLLPEETLDRYPTLLIYRARCAAQVGDGEAALRLSGQALDLLHEGPDIALAQAHVARAAAFRLTGLLERAVQECDRSIDLLLDTPDREARMTLAESYHHKGTASNQGGKLPEAKTALEQALSLYRDDGDLYHIAYVNHHLGSVNRGLGDFGRSAAHYREAENGYRKLGNRVGLASTLNNLGNLLVSQGRLPAAEEALTESARYAEEGSSPRVLSHALDSLGDALRHMGQYTRALTTYRQGLEAARACSEHKTLIQSQEGMALSYLALGDFMTARMTIEEAVGQTGTQTGAEIAGRLLTSQSIVQRSLGLFQEARRSIMQARQLLEQAGTNETKARCAFNYAALLWAEHETGVRPLLDEVAEMLGDPGREAVLLFDARIALPFLQRAAGKDSDSVFQRLVDAVAEFPGETHEDISAAATEDQPAVRAYGLGNGAVDRADQQPSRVRWASEKTKELFFFLLVRGGPVQKEEILDALWPDADPGKADTQFWTTAYRMRNGVHADCLIREGSTYRINPAIKIWFDVPEFEGLVREALRSGTGEAERASKLQRAINLYNGPMLKEFYAEWTDAIRTRLEERYLAALMALAQIWSQKGGVEPVIELCDKALEANSFYEDAAAMKIEALARAGRIGEAEAAYQTHVKALETELSEEPGERVSDIYRTLVHQAR
jgi:LuxR family maltose regulon positive regulatory protein